MIYIFQPKGERVRLKVFTFRLLPLSFHLLSKGIVILKLCQEIHRIYTIGIIPQRRLLAFAEIYYLVAHI
jgi:hypothetical protein